MALLTGKSSNDDALLGKRAKTASGRLGTRMRGALTEAYESRGGGKSNLWLVYSPKADKDFVLRSDLEFGHFLLAESDPEIEKIDYAPGKRVETFAGEGIATIVDAEITLQGGTVVWREIKRSEDVQHGAQGRANLQLMVQLRAAEKVCARHELLTEKDIFANPMRIRNWLRIIPWLAQARAWPLQQYLGAVSTLLKRRGLVTLEQVLELGNDDDATCPLYAAALFKTLQSGGYGHDLNERPLSLNTIFFRHEVKR